MKAKYAEKIETLVKEGLIRLHGDRLLVEIMDPGEKVTASGLIVETPTAKKNPLANDSIALVRVLAVGEGYYTDKDGKLEFVPLTNKPGDNIMISTHALATYKEFFLIKDYKENTIGLASQDNVHATVNDIDKFLEILKN